MRRSKPQPIDTVKYAGAMLRGAWPVWAVRTLWQLLAHGARFLAVFLAGLWFVAHLGTHIASGGVLLSWPDALVETLSQPHIFVGLAGIVFTTSLLFLAAESWVFASMWGGILDRQVTRASRLRDVVRAGFADFDRALTLRLLVRVTEFALLALVVGTLTALYRLTHGLSVLAAAASWGAGLAGLTVTVILVRLTAELAAAAVFVDDVGLGEAIQRAAAHVVIRPVHLYRLFVLSAGILLPAFVLAWAAALGQNLLIGTSLEAGAWALRIAAEVFVAVGIGMFSVLLHGTFFTYYARNALSATEGAALMAKHSPSLEELLPQSYDYVVDLDDILAPNHPTDRMGGGEAAPPTAPAGRYDLSAILDEGEDPQRK